MKIHANQIQPFADRVLIEPDPIDVENSLGIIIPENAKEKPQTGTVIAVGAGAQAEILGDPEAKRAVMEAIGEKAFDTLSYMIKTLVVVKNESKVGDKVLFGKYAGTEIEIDGKKYLIMRDADIIAGVND